MSSSSEKALMKVALSLAERGRATTQPNPMVGAVIVKNSEIVGEGYHERTGQAHAEIKAINNAGEKGEGGTLYVNLEPCSHQGKTPPCTGAIISAGISRVVCSDVDPNPIVHGKGLNALRASGISVSVGILREESRKLNEIYYKYVTTGNPFVTLKMAQSLDGRITCPGMGKWVSGTISRRMVHRLRSHNLAIMTGIGTVEADDPLLNVRYGDSVADSRRPLRVIVDSTLRLKEDSKIVETASLYPTAVFTGPGATEEKAGFLRDHGIEVFRAPLAREKKLDLQWILQELGTREISSVLVEGGKELATSMINQDQIDKIVLFIAPRLTGEGLGVVGKLRTGRTPPWLELKEIRVDDIDGDIMVTGYPKHDGD